MKWEIADPDGELFSYDVEVLARPPRPWSFVLVKTEKPRRGAEYKVLELRPGLWDCDCDDFKYRGFRKRGAEGCKHLEKVWDWLDEKEGFEVAPAAAVAPADLAERLRPAPQPVAPVLALLESAVSTTVEAEVTTARPIEVPQNGAVVPYAAPGQSLPASLAMYLLSAPRPKLAAGLIEAIRACQSVAPDKRNNFHGYNYTSSEAIIEEGKAALLKGGLVLLPVEASVVGSEREGPDRFELVRILVLMHTSGESAPLKVTWPIYVDKGKPLDKATAAADTLSLAYLLRDLLLMVRVAPDDEVSGRDDRNAAPAPAPQGKPRSQPRPRPVPTPAAAPAQTKHQPLHRRAGLHRGSAGARRRLPGGPTPRHDLPGHERRETGRDPRGQARRGVLPHQPRRGVVARPGDQPRGRPLRRSRLAAGLQGGRRGEGPRAPDPRRGRAGLRPPADAGGCAGIDEARTPLGPLAMTTHDTYHTIADLASGRKLSLDFLTEAAGLEDLPGGGITIPYWDQAGNHLFDRARDVPGRARFTHPTGLKLAPYGLWRLHEVGHAGVLYLVEGESDCWAAWQHGIPCLGLPGDSTAACLEAEERATC